VKNHPPVLEFPDRFAAAGGAGAEVLACDDWREALRRAERGFASCDDLLLLGSDPVGLDALLDREAVVWPQLRCLAVVHPEVIPPFAEWFRVPERLGPYLDAAFEGAADEDAVRWEKYWAVVVNSLDGAACTELFLGLLRSRRRDLGTLTRPGRSILRREARRRLTAATPELVPLLFPCDAVECREILGDPGLPAEWRGFALAATLKTSKAQAVRRDVSEAALAVLREAPADLLGQYILRAQHIYPEHPELWHALAESHFDRGEVVDRLLELGGAVAPARWHPLLDDLGAFADRSVLHPDRLLRVLAAAGAESDAWPLWEALVGRLDARFLAGDFSQAGEWSSVERARRRAVRDRATFLPDHLAAKLDAGIALQRWMNRREADAEPAHLHAAFAALGCPLPASLHTIYRRAFGAPTVGGDLPKLERFAELFLALYPVAVNTEAAAAAWQSIAATVPSPDREALQGYFWARMVPEVPREKRTESVPIAPVSVAAPQPAWKFEALLYSGIIGMVALMLGALLLFW
jgi:hypothetical protein